MKWYSVKKHAPPMETICLIFTDSNYYYVGKLISSDDVTVWSVDHESDEYGSNVERIFSVTHFCIPDPVEVEE